MVDERWNLAWTTAERAWGRLPKKPDGTIDWGDVRVAHLDTGFTRHEAFGPWSPSGTSKTMLTRLGKDYFKRNRPNATDPLKSGFLGRRRQACSAVLQARFHRSSTMSFPPFARAVRI